MKRLGTYVLLFFVTGLLQSAFPQNRSLSPMGGWVEQTSPTTNELWDVNATSVSVVWALGAHGPILRTTNGGTLWSIVGSTSPFPNGILEDLEPIDDQKALLAVGTNDATIAAIMRTTNAGATWDTVFAQTGGFLTSIRMFDKDNGMAIGLGVPHTLPKFTLLRTTNGGVSWGSLDAPEGLVSGVLPWGLTSVGSSNIWFVGNDGRIYRSTDGGGNWGTVRPFGSSVIISIAFNDPLNGVLTTSSGISAWTADGGTTWTQVALPDTGVAGGAVGTGMDFFVANGPKIYRSTDRGHSWNTSYAGGIGHVNALGLVAQGTNLICWALSAGGNIARYDGTITGIAIPSNEIPRTFVLEQNFPNPFNPSTTIRYGLPQRIDVSLTVFNTIGQQVATLVQGDQEAGYHEVRFDASGLSSGVYFYRLQAGTYVETRKLLLLR